MMTIRNSILLVASVGLILLLLMRNDKEMTRSRLTTKLPAIYTNVVDNDNNSTTTIPLDSLLSNNFHQKHGSFCSLVQHARGGAFQSPSHWWTTHLDDILNASQHPRLAHYSYRNWTMSLLATLSPEMLQQGIRSRPSGPALDRVARIVHQRMTDPENSPPLQIAVTGGSVTRGQGCNEPDLPGRISPSECAWPRRLELFINTYAGMELVQVYNLAVSATNLEFGTPLVKYQLYPQEWIENGGPDVIVSSYATNEQGYAINAELQRSRVQDFVKACSSSSANSCSATSQPLVVFVDDYLGNHKDNILSEMSFNKVVTEIADWYPQVMHVSYADVVRRAIYANTDESTFSPSWPYDPRTGKPQVEPHFGMAGHVAIVFSVVYAMMEVATGYCDNKAFVEQVGHEGVFSKPVLDRMNTVPPPELKPSLLLSKVSDKWRENQARLQERQSKCHGRDDTTTFKTPCEFAFLCGPYATVQTTEQFHEYLKPYLVSSKDWEPVMEYGSGASLVEKLGLVASGANASMTLRLSNIQKEVRIINLQRIKSYGDKWAGSNARFTVKIENPGSITTAQFQVGGHHEIKHSVSFPYEYDLKDHKAVKGANITLSMNLVGGTAFKIIGMMLCEY